MRLLYQGTCSLPASQIIHLHCLANSLGLSLVLGAIAEAQGERREGEEVVERRQNGGVMEVGTVEKRRSTTDDNMEVVEAVQVNDLNGRLQNLVERRTELKEREEQEIMEEQETENEDEEAVKVQGTARSSKSSGEERENVENSREEYDVEQILAKKKLNNKNLYLVKWKGFEEEQDRTWEPAKAFTGELAKKLYRKFNAEQRKRIGGEFCRKNVEAEDFHAEVERYNLCFIFIPGFLAVGTLR